MLLCYVTVCWVLFGGSSAEFTEESECYGRSLTFPSHYAPPLFNGKMYFTPKNGGSSKLMMEKGEVKDPRLKVSIGLLKLTDLTDRDAGTFSIAYNDDIAQYNIIKLKIKDCDEEITRYHGSSYSYRVPRGAEFLEFTPIDSADLPKVLWNRTDIRLNRKARGQMKSRAWEIMNLNQADNGYYTFRDKDNSFLSRIQLSIHVNYEDYDKIVGQWFHMEYPKADVPWTVTHTQDPDRGYLTLVKEGKLFAQVPDSIEVTPYGIDFHHLEFWNSGSYKFSDPQGHVAKEVTLRIEPEPIPVYVYAAIVGGIILGFLLCFCCVKKCCCKKSSSKRDESAPQTAAAPAVYYHDMHQPAGPSYSATPAQSSPHHPINSLASREPATTSFQSSVPNTVNIHVNPRQSEFAPLGGQGADAAPLLSSNCLSSDPEPQYHLKGLSFDSAPPLSSDSTISDVYNSDKLNFL